MEFLILLFLTLTIRETYSQASPPSLTVSINVTEEQPVGTILTNLVTAADLSQHYSPESLNTLYFVLMDYSTLGRDLIEVDSSSNVRVRKPIDRDTLCPNLDRCELKLDFLLQPFTAFNNLLKLKITVLDINDNAPKFAANPPVLELSLSESAQPGTQLVLPAATDADEGVFGVQGYRIEPADLGIFRLRVIQNPGGADDVSLILERPVDRETRDAYDLKLVAYDGGQRNGSLSIHITIIDVNDNPPRFEQDTYEVSVREDVPVGSTIIHVTAFDADAGSNGLVRYSLAASTSPAAAAMFGVAGASGAVYTLAALDHETAAAHFLSVECRDLGAPTALAAYAKLRVAVRDVNDHAPAIAVHALGGGGANGGGNGGAGEEDVVRVVEGAPAGTFVAQISVNDPDSGDNGRFTCVLDSSPDFVLQPLNAAEYKLLTTSNARFDRETQATHRVVIRCTDAGDAPRTATAFVAVHVADINDHAPTFPRANYQATIEENNAPGTFIARLNASDADAGENARISYSLEVLEPLGIDASDLVTIHRDSGLVTAIGVLDHEAAAKYVFRVVASDHGDIPKTATATLTLTIRDVNDCAPQFSQDIFTFGTFENQAEQTEIGTLTAIDRDDAPYNEIRYALDPRMPDSASFDINPYSGQIRTRKVLDRELQYRYDIRVLASNEGYYLTGATNVTVHVADKNDNAPVVTYPQNSNNTVQVNTLAQVGSPVAQIEAHDLDLGLNAALKFSIVSGNDAGFFEMDAALGWVLVAKDLTQEPSQYQAVVVLVQDQGQPQLSSVSQFQFFLNDSLAILAAEQAEKDSNTTAILVICLLVFLITAIVIVLFVFVLLRRRRRRQRERGHKYNCRVAEANKLAHNNAMNEEKDEEAKEWPKKTNGLPTVIMNPQAHSSPVKPRESVDRGRKNCDMREIQLQVHDLLVPGRAQRQHPHNHHHDPDSDSLTDSGKGPSEEGDHPRPPLPSDSIDDLPVPSIPPRLPHRSPRSNNCDAGYPGAGVGTGAKSASNYCDVHGVHGQQKGANVSLISQPSSEGYINEQRVSGRKQQPVGKMAKSVHFQQPYGHGQTQGQGPNGHSQGRRDNFNRPSSAHSQYAPSPSPISPVHSQQTEPYYRHPPYLYESPNVRGSEMESEEESDGESSTSGSFVIDHRGSEHGMATHQQHQHQQHQQQQQRRGQFQRDVIV